MAASSYDGSLARLLVHEGGYTNHPSDPGGPTKFGITIFDYRKYVKPGATAADVKAMTLDEAKRIYRAKYWDAQRCDALPAGVDYAIFDYGVNSGIGRSGKVLRRCLKLVDSTSVVNDGVIYAADHADAKKLIEAICDERLRFLKGLRTWPVFGVGWGRRVAEVRKVALALAAKADTQSLPLPAGPSSGEHADKGVVAVAKGAQQGSAGAVVAAGAAAAQQAHSSGARPWLVAAIVIVVIAAAIGAWASWRWRQRQQQERPA